MPSTTPFDFASLARPCVVGVVNVTPNSFSDGGRFFDPQAAIAHAHVLATQGAGVLDLGAEASSFFRAGVEPVEESEQARRLLPVVEGLRHLAGVVLSVDTRAAVVAREALAGGARIVNDISAGTHDAAMFSLVAATGAGIILMHIGAGYPRTPPADDPQLLQTVRRFFVERIRVAREAGIRLAQLAIDPGLGFGKTMADNWRLAMGAGELLDLGVPVMLGASRKRFLETLPPADVGAAGVWENWVVEFGGMLAERGLKAAHERDVATGALTAMAVRRGVMIQRVHDVAIGRLAVSAEVVGCGVWGRRLES